MKTFFVLMVLAMSPFNYDRIMMPEPMPNNKSLFDVLDKFESASQIYEMSSTLPKEIVSNKGVVIFVQPDDLETLKGKDPGKTITIEVKELWSRNELSHSNVSTVISDKFLNAGGVYYINFRSNEQDLQLKPGKKLMVQFPAISSNNLNLYYGERHPEEFNIISWENDDEWQDLKIQGENSTNDKNTSGVYDVNVKGRYRPVGLQKLGWICVAESIKNDEIGLILEEPNLQDIDEFRLYVGFEDVNVVSIFSCRDKGIVDMTGLLEFYPKGAKLKLLMFCTKGNDMYMYSNHLVMNEGVRIKPLFQKISQEQLQSLFTL